ncbi:DUF1206 domain-containing protein [Spongiactinospora sp. TRM90649]|uniref:DUF1206 domain-containing protein n=1 Tax=Spongiactinospora sp. TRM90649 TaxID=3031114 RepID=UPI0023F789CA|nr:DUF1206 domain-containing protein [Spongiactinospora sp. TRM90649]MDF5758285.1 DUF1206 domain-containing protein [Spongiactinospora sp. TRM90649]
MTGVDRARAAAERAADHPALDRAARAGLACRGVLYALIGVLALRIAFGDGEQEADKGGAISAVAGLPLGSVLLWAMVAGFAGLGVWQASEALVGRGETTERVKSAGRVVIYVFVVTTLLSMLLAGKTTSEDQKSRDLAGFLLDLPGGPFIVGAVGVGVIAMGVYWLHAGLTRRFHRELERGRMSGRARSIMEKLGIAGHVARGMIAGAAGYFVVRAAFEHDPGDAKGIDATLRSFADTPAGPWLLAVVASGLVLFALYCLGEVRWRRT